MVAVGAALLLAAGRQESREAPTAFSAGCPRLEDAWVPEAEVLRGGSAAQWTGPGPGPLGGPIPSLSLVESDLPTPLFERTVS